VPVRKWHIAGKDAQRQLHVQLVQPAAGALTCHLDLLPRLLLAPGETSLRLPAPVGAKTAEAAVAYRLDGLEAADRLQNLTVASLPADQFTGLWGSLGGSPLPGVTRAFSFRRIAVSAALGLALQGRKPQGELECRWTVTAPYAELRAHATLSVK